MINTLLIIDAKKRLFTGLEDVLKQDEYESLRANIIDAAFEEVFKAHSEGRLEWKRTPRGLKGEEELMAVARVRDGRDCSIKLPVFISRGIYESTGDANEDPGSDGACLRFGFENGIKRTEGDDPQIAELAESLLGRTNEVARPLKT